MSLITKQDLAEYMGVPLDPKDTKIDVVANAVSAWVEQYTSRHFVNDPETESVEVTEYHDYAPVIFLNEADIQSVDKVTVNGVDVDVADLKIDMTTGRVRITRYGYAEYGRNYFDAIKVVYKVGAKLPEDLKLAILQLASDNYNRSDTGTAGNIASESVGGYSVSYGGTVMVKGSENASQTPADYMNVFNYYKRVHL